jgi:cyclopropane fatty-acyl-phospholipid synthase-like methyltransferase
MAKQSDTFLSMLYDFWSPHIEEDEFLFYHRLLKACLHDGGKALELSCGSGRLLLPFAAEGMDVSGIEGSIELCAVLKKRATEAGVSINVSQMQLDNVEIKGKYKVIYSTLGSFQMVTDYDDATILLSKIYTALEDDGVVSIALFLPLKAMALPSNDWVIASDHKDPDSKQRYVRREKSFHDEVEQLIEGKIRYETWLGWDLLEMEEKDLKLRWYSQHEFIFLLREAGFKDISLHRSYNETEGHKKSFMLFLARK